MKQTQMVTTCLWFDRHAEEAANFYVSLFPNSEIVELSRYGPGAQLPEGTALMIVFYLGGTRMMALNGGPMFTPNEACSLVVQCETQAEIDRLWSRLTADGGQESMCGWLKDRYGFSWQITPTRLPALLGGNDPEASKRAWTALMTMRKIDIAALEAARAEEGASQ